MSDIEEKDTGKKDERTPLWLVIVAVVIAIIAIRFFAGGSDSSSSSSSTKTKESTITVISADSISYQKCDIDTMLEELDKNALSASEKYKGKDVELKGKLSTIDSDGKYISIQSLTKDSIFSSIRCDINNDSQKNVVLQLSKGDTIIVKGTITTVGEIIGYALSIDEIEKE